MAKRVSAQRVKIHRQYTYDSAADVLGVTVQTVRAWRQEGLEVMQSTKPHLILGHDLKRFIQNRKRKSSGKLEPDTFYCMTCDGQKRAYGAMADYEPYNSVRGRLVALCETCQKPCGKFANPKTCDDLATILTIATRHRT